MKNKNGYFIDDTLYYINDKKDKQFCFHTLFGLAFNYDKLDSIISGLKELLEKYEIIYFLTREEMGTRVFAFYDDDYEYEDRNTNFQENTLKALKDEELFNYIKDMLLFGIENELVVFKSSDHRWVIENESFSYKEFTDLYESQTNNIINSYLDAFDRDDGDVKNLHFLTNEKFIANYLKEMGFEDKCKLEEEKRRLMTLHIYLDFFHAYLNLVLAILTKKKKSDLELQILSLYKEYAQYVAYDKYRKVRKAAEEITKAILDMKYKKD